MSEIIYEEGLRHRGNGLDGVPAVFETPTKLGFAIESAYAQIKMMVIDNTNNNFQIGPKIIQKCQVYVGDLLVVDMDGGMLEIYATRYPPTTTSLADITNTQSYTLRLPWPKLGANNHDSTHHYKVRYQLTYNQAMFPARANQHIHDNNGTKILWIEDSMWFKLRPTGALGVPYSSMRLEGWFGFTYQVRTPTGATQIEDSLVLPLSSDMRLRSLDIIYTPLTLVRANILLNGNSVSYKDVPMNILCRESPMAIKRFYSSAENSIVYINICDAVDPKNELILTKANDKIRIQVEFGVDQDRNTVNNPTTTVQVLACVNYHM